MQVAVITGNINVVKLLLANGTSDLTLLFASSGGHSEIVKLALEYGANIHVEDDQSLWLAFKHGHVGVVKLLFDSGCNFGVAFNGKNGERHD